jgi:hypothetical protein
VRIVISEEGETASRTVSCDQWVLQQTIRRRSKEEDKQRREK